MLRILLVKTSSLGDVVHNLPVASDIHRHYPEAAIDWIVEESYVSLVRLHPSIRRVIPVALRRWRRRMLATATWQDIGEFRRLSRSENYDAVIDTQGLVKSALIARSARGRRHGFDAASAREPLAARLYDSTHPVRRGQHAVVRNRQLAAAALGYRIDEPADYGLSGHHTASAARRYCVLLHGTSRPDKLWPVEAWTALGRSLEVRGLDCVLPWGDDRERQRSERIAGGLTRALVPGQLPLERIADLLSGSAATVGVDTGLVHLAAALGVPVVAIFSGSDPLLTGVFGSNQSRNLGRPGAAPGPDAIIDALAELKAL